jgi:hypothetical protein
MLNCKHYFYSFLVPNFVKYASSASSFSCGISVAVITSQLTNRLYRKYVSPCSLWNRSLASTFRKVTSLRVTGTTARMLNCFICFSFCLTLIYILSSKGVTRLVTQTYFPTIFFQFFITYL